MSNLIAFLIFVLPIVLVVELFILLIQAKKKKQSLKLPIAVITTYLLTIAIIIFGAAYIKNMDSNVSVTARTVINGKEFKSNISVPKSTLKFFLNN